MKNIRNIVVGLLVLFGVYWLLVNREGFTSPGTMVQLATSHVPTEEDAYYMNYIYPKIVKRDLINMTGSY
jgi:hypothetical protein